MSNPQWALICNESNDLFVEPLVDNEIDAVKTWHYHIAEHGEDHAPHMLMVPWTEELASLPWDEYITGSKWLKAPSDNLLDNLSDKSIFKLPNNETLCRMLRVGPSEFSAPSTAPDNNQAVETH